MHDCILKHETLICLRLPNRPGGAWCSFLWDDLQHSGLNSTDIQVALLWGKDHATIGEKILPAMSSMRSRQISWDKWIPMCVMASAAIFVVFVQIGCQIIFGVIVFWWDDVKEKSVRKQRRNTKKRIEGNLRNELVWGCVGQRQNEILGWPAPASQGSHYKCLFGVQV